MAFAFGNPPNSTFGGGAFGSNTGGGSNAQTQTGPDLEEIQTEVRKNRPQKEVKDLTYLRLLDFKHLPASRRYGFYHHHGLQMPSLLRHLPSLVLHQKKGSWQLEAQSLL